MPERRAGHELVAIPIEFYGATLYAECPLPSGPSGMTVERRLELITDALTTLLEGYDLRPKKAEHPKSALVAEARRALRCLALEVPELVHSDVSTKVEDALTALGAPPERS